MKIQLKLLLFVLSASLIPLSLATYIAIIEADRALENSELSALAQMVTEEIHEFELTIKADTQDAILIANTPAIKKIAHQLKENISMDDLNLLKEKNTMLSYWEDIMKIKPNLQKMEYNDGRGNEIATIVRNDDGSFTTNTNTVGDIDHLAYLANSQDLKEGEIYISDIYSNFQSTNNFFISYVTPVFVNKINHGFIIIDFYPKNDFVGLNDEHEGFESFILDNQMRLISSQNFLALNHFNYLEENLSNLIIDGFFDGEMNSFETKDSIDIGWQKFTYDEYDLNRFFVLVIVSDQEPETTINDTLLFTFVVTAILVTIISLVISRSISKPMIELSNLSKKIVEGKLEPSRIKYTNDEIGVAIENFNKLIVTLKNFSEEVTRVAKEVGTDGKLGGQANVENVSGIWKELTDSVNTMASNLTTQVRDIKNVATSVASGDLTKKVSVQVKGEVLELKNSINSMIDQLAKVDHDRDEFASMITHELKTPLVPIKGHADMLSKPGMLGELNSEQQDSVDEIKKYTQVLAELIEQFLLVHKLEIDKVPFIFQKLDVKSCLLKAHSANISLMAEKNIDFTVDVPDGLYVNADPEKCGEVFTNIILNAVDFVPNKNGKIILSAKKSGESVEVIISDNGIGISKKDQKNLFIEKFYQVDKSLRRKHGGSGLGLYICKNIIEKHGGTISMMGELGEGCSFVIKLPSA